MNLQNNRELVKLLWTGGWDSTYRLVELSRLNVVVQPIYLHGDGRVSEPQERDAMSKILASLERKQETKATILPPLNVHIGDLTPDEEITRAYQKVHAVTNLGSQHEWLAWYANANPGLEIGTEENPPERSRIIDSLMRFCSLKESGNVSNYIIDRDKSTPEGRLLFGHLKFPIIKKTPLQMLEAIKEWEYEDVMQHIWFCHVPIYGKPCGYCHPCQLKMECGMGFLLPPAAQRRFKTVQRLQGSLVYYPYRAYRRLMRMTFWRPRAHVNRL